MRMSAFSAFIVFLLILEDVTEGCKKTSVTPPKPRCKFPLASRQLTESGGRLACSGHADPFYNVPKNSGDIAAQLLAKGGILENGTLVVHEELAIPKEDPETSVCHLTCLPGFVPSPDSSASCHDGVWDQDPATMMCLPSSCGAPTDPEHGKYNCFGNPSTCYLMCDPGYVTMEKTTINCLDGNWDLDTNSIKCEVAVALLIGGSVFSSGASFPEGCQTAEIFSLQDETCSSAALPPLLVGVLQHTSHLLDGEILICGGQDCGRIVEKISAKETSRSIYTETKSMESCFKMQDDNTWSLHSVLHSPSHETRMQHSGAIQQNKLQLMGGLWREADAIIELQEQNWAPGRIPPFPLAVFSISLFKPCLVVTSPVTYLVIGGSYSLLTNEKGTAVVEFNSLTEEWRALPNLPVGRSDHACTLVTTKSGPGVMVAGGENLDIQEQVLDSVFLLDLGTETWFPAGNMNMGRKNMGLVALGDKVLVLGSAHHSYQDGNETVEEYVVPCSSMRECTPSQEGVWTLTERQIERRNGLAVLPVAASRFNCTG